jgi:hypothetical protein
MRTRTLLKISAAMTAVPLALAIAVDRAAAACKPGYVWRDAKDGDGVCVTPAGQIPAAWAMSGARH